MRLGRADRSGAEEDSMRILGLGRSANVPESLMPALAIRVAVLVDTDRIDEARPLAEELRSLAVGSYVLTGGTELVAVARCTGADAWLEALERPDPWRSPWLEALPELLRGDPERAVQLYAALEAPIDAAFARMEAAKVHFASGRRSEAEVHLETALAFYRRAGATRHLGEAEALRAAPAQRGRG